VRELLERTRAFLAERGCESARLESELLAGEALGIERLRVFLELDRPLAPHELARARELVRRRGRGEPCAYVIGRKEFYARPFEVGPGVLVPRPETELLVDLARGRLTARERPAILDVGTGSGCIAITLALELPGARVVASDLSPRALDYARRNAARHGVELELVQGDGLAPVAGRRFDLVVSNPPYVDPAERASLAPDVRDFEPPEALFAPPGERDHWARRLALEAPAALAPGGTLLVELGHDQAPHLRPWLAERGIAHTLHRDHGGVERVLEIAAPRP
jgi:release factor glutamine methyltransferase